MNSTPMSKASRLLRGVDFRYSIAAQSLEELRYENIRLSVRTNTKIEADVFVAVPEPKLEITSLGPFDGVSIPLDEGSFLWIKTRLKQVAQSLSWTFDTNNISIDRARIIRFRKQKANLQQEFHTATK